MSDSIPQIDPTSHAWGSVKAWAEIELKRAREDLEAVDLPEKAADALRGRISALKELLNLPVTTEPIASASADYGGAGESH